MNRLRGVASFWRGAPLLASWFMLLAPTTMNAQGIWASVDPMPTARWTLAAATGTDGKIYAIGGFADAGEVNSLDTVELYNPGTNSWTTSAPMPTARGALAAVMGTDSRVYAIGGLGGIGGLALNTVESYDASLGSWATVAPMPTARYFHAAVSGPDGRIYVIGGQIGQSSISDYLSSLEIYDPTTNTWSTGAPMPTPRAQLAAAVGTDGKIYAIGGSNIDAGFLNTVESYDPTTDSWSTVAPMSIPHAYLGAATGPDGRIYAIGGHSDPQQIVDKVEAYDLSSGTWSTVSPLPTARQGLAAALGADSRIYAIGGNGSGPDYPVLATVEAFTANPQVNHQPVLNVPTSVIGVALQPITFTATATDPDGDAVTFSLIGAPAGAVINVSSGAFSWTPPAAGTFTFQVQATDSHGATDTKSVTATVQPRGQAAIDSASIVLTRNVNVVTASYDLVNKASVAVTNVVVTSSTLKNTPANQPLPGAVTIPANGSVHESVQFIGVPAGGPVFLIINLSFDGGTLTFKKSVTVP